MKPNLDPTHRDYRQWRKIQKLEAKQNRRLGQRRRAQGNVCAATAGKSEREVRQERARELRAREAMKRPQQDPDMRRVIEFPPPLGDNVGAGPVEHVQHFTGQR